MLCKFLNFKPLRALLEPHSPSHSAVLLLTVPVQWQSYRIGLITRQSPGHDPSVDALRKETKGSQLLQ